MTGEMSREEVTREVFPLHFAAADAVDGATVEPFDQYQGPYVRVPGRGRYFLVTVDGVIAEWWEEATGDVSGEFLCHDPLADKWSRGEFVSLIGESGDRSVTAQDRWRAAARAASFLYRAADVRTTTQAGWLIEDAARLLCEAGLCDLADEAHEAAEAWTDADLAKLQSRVAEAAGKLESTYLETEL